MAPPSTNEKAKEKQITVVDELSILRDKNGRFSYSDLHHEEDDVPPARGLNSVPCLRRLLLLLGMVCVVLGVLLLMLLLVNKNEEDNGVAQLPGRLVSF